MHQFTLKLHHVLGLVRDLTLLLLNVASDRSSRHLCRFGGFCEIIAGFTQRDLPIAICPQRVRLGAYPFLDRRTVLRHTEIDDYLPRIVGSTAVAYDGTESSGNADLICTFIPGLLFPYMPLTLWKALDNLGVRP